MNTSQVLTIDSLALDSHLIGSLDESLLVAQSRLQEFAQDADFAEKMAIAFGDNINFSSLQEKWKQGEIIFPTVEVRSAYELGNAYGAFAIATGKIYLAQELLENRALEKVVPVLLEEYGHFVDTQLNAVDAPGDEGAIFSALVRGETLDGSQLSALKAEDDSALLSIDDQTIAIEQANVTWIGGSGDWYDGANWSTGLVPGSGRAVSF